MTARHALNWLDVMDMRRYMARVARATDLDPETVNRFIAEEVQNLKRMNPDAADELCDGALDDVDNDGVRDAWREFAWMWLAGQSLIHKGGNK